MLGFTSLIKWAVILLSVSLVVQLSAAASSGVRFADTVWDDSRPEALNALYSPFVVSLAAGNLDFETYAQYIYQDAYYAKAAADANVVAMNYAVDPRAKEIFAMFNDSNSRGAVSFQEWLDEYRPNVTYPINNATTNYTNFLNNTVHGIIEGYPKPFTGPIVSVFSLASFIPCWKLYYFIGKHIVAAVGDYQGNPYSDWIYGNSKDSLGVKLAKIDGVFDYLAANLTRDQLGIVEQVYRKGMTCEVEFFLAQPLFQNTSVPLTRDLSNATEQLLIFSSFDGTSSVVDSSPVLANLAISSASKKSQVKAEWGRLFSQYKEECGLGVENISSSAKKDFHYYTVSKALEIFSHIESANILRVNQSEALAGIQVAAIQSAGEDMILLQDFVTFFQRIVKRQNLNSTANVISSGWSASLIKAAFSSVDLKQLQVHANELAVNKSGVFSDGIIDNEVIEGILDNHYGVLYRGNEMTANGPVSTGGIIDTIVSPADKVQVLEDIVKNYRAENKLTVYVGESVEDLLSLLSVDIGIVIGPSSSLKRVGAQLGVTFKSLFSGSINVQERTFLERRPSWTAPLGVLYTVSSWTEIDAFILGWQNHFG